MSKEVSPKKYERAFNVLEAQKTAHMVKIQDHNPSFAGCPIDDYTDAIDLALMLLWDKFN